jgi:large subunit ribosomal protein L17
VKHRVYGKILGRNRNKRAALFRNLVQSLILAEKIQTTEAKAKAVKGLVDKIINQAKSPTTRRLVSQFLVRKEPFEKLVKDLVPRLKSRSSGYSSIVKIGRRLGDRAMMVQMKLLTEEAKVESKPKDVKLAKEAKPGNLKTQNSKRKTTS